MDAKQFFYDFGKALYHVDAVYDDYARRSGVAPTLLWILYALNDGAPHTQREICADWALPKSTVNTVMTELKKNGYVELAPIKGKRREMTVTLTQSGKSYADRVLSALYRKEAAVFCGLPPEALQLIEYLDRIVTLLRETELPEGGDQL